MTKLNSIDIESGEEDFGGPGPERDEDSSEGFTYEGDRGMLPLPLRNVLVRLLKGHYLTSTVRPADWKLLLQNRQKSLSSSQTSTSPR